MTVMDVSRAALTQPRVKITADAVQRPVQSTRWVSTYRTALLATDTLVALAVVTAVAATAGSSWPLHAVPVVWLALAALCGAYRPNVLGAGAHDARAVLLTGVVALAAIPVAGTLGVDPAGTSVLAPVLLTITALTGLARGIGRGVLRRRRQAGACTQRVLVVGDATRAVEMVDRLRRASDALDAVAVIVPSGQVDQARELGLAVSVLAVDDPEQVVAVARQHGADAVLLVPGGDIATSVWRSVSRACEWHGLQLMFSPAVVDVATSAPVIPVAGVPVLVVPRPGPAGAGQAAKQLVDRVGAGIGLIVLAPLLAAIAVAIRLDDRGPVFFRQTRVGADGEHFTILKLRTMRVDAEAVRRELAHLNEGGGPLFKMQHDPRITRVGRVLRKLSLDELPQLWNVMTGEMSLVGPRPPLPSEVAEYSRAERRRLLVKPGLTGLWQVGGRSNLTWQESVKLDLAYVETWSLPLDLRILARTIPAVVRGTGAY